VLVVCWLCCAYFIFVNRISHHSLVHPSLRSMVIMNLNTAIRLNWSIKTPGSLLVTASSLFISPLIVRSLLFAI
jgi:hypothetical protein